ncbi:hypothetical protein [Streptomyces flaveolus]|uniref:hypothetical protein n=1 Tax=Streptomyces flaveolus TaxID=67297 RepID=UPI0036FCA882
MDSQLAWAKRNGLIFRNPASRIKVGKYEYAVLQPLIPGQVDHSVAAATTPATRLILALAAVHAARVAQIANLTPAPSVADHREPPPADQQQTAHTTSRAGNHWISAPMRGQEATLERLRVGRQFEEAMVRGPDPLHLAEKTAMRYADSARALLEHTAEQIPESGQ